VAFKAVGDAHAAQGDLRAALTSYRAALVITERLAKDDPSNVQSQRGFGVSRKGS
jgi:hypothetical protein